MQWTPGVLHADHANRLRISHQNSALGHAVSVVITAQDQHHSTGHISIIYRSLVAPLLGTLVPNTGTIGLFGFSSFLH